MHHLSDAGCEGQQASLFSGAGKGGARPGAGALRAQDAALNDLRKLRVTIVAATCLCSAGASLASRLLYPHKRARNDAGAVNAHPGHEPTSQSPHTCCERQGRSMDARQ